MKTNISMRSFIATLTYLFSCLCTMAYVKPTPTLPAPVFGEEPVIARIEIVNIPKDYNGYGHLGIENQHSHWVWVNAEPDRSYFEQTKNGTIIVDTIKIGMTSSLIGEISIIKVEIDKDDSQKVNFVDEISVPFLLIANPGENILVRYDAKKNKFTIKSALGKINEELTKNYHNLKDNDLLPTKESYSDEEMEAYNDMPVEDFMLLKLKDFNAAWDKVYNNKKLSDAYKEMWYCRACVNYRSSTYQYQSYFASKRNYDWSIDDNKLRVHADEFMSPYLCNGLFYTNPGKTIFLHSLELTNEPMRTEWISGKKVPVTKELNEYYNSDVVSYDIGFRNMTYSELEKYRDLIPHYYDILKKYIAKRDKEKAELMASKGKGTICTIDRNLEGEDLIKELTKKYGGKPTIYVFNGNSYNFMDDIYCKFSLYDKNKEWFTKLHEDSNKKAMRYRETFNLAFLTGGRWADEDEWQIKVKEYEGDHYFIMKNQFMYFQDKYGKLSNEHMYADQCALLVDAEGNIIAHAGSYEELDALNEMIDKMVPQE